jgi:hypothetical protein
MQLGVNRQTKNEDKKERASPGFLVSGGILGLPFLTLRPVPALNKGGGAFSFDRWRRACVDATTPTPTHPPILNPWGSGPGLQEKGDGAPTQALRRKLEGGGDDAAR